MFNCSSFGSVMKWKPFLYFLAVLLSFYCYINSVCHVNFRVNETQKHPNAAHQMCQLAQLGHQTARHRLLLPISVRNRLFSTLPQEQFCPFELELDIDFRSILLKVCAFVRSFKTNTVSESKLPMRICFSRLHSPCASELVPEGGENVKLRSS